MAKMTTTDVKATTKDTLTALERQFKAARLVSTPLIAIATSDQAATIEQLSDRVLTDANPIVKWDVCNGLKPVNKLGQKALIDAKLTDPGATEMPHQALIGAQTLPPNTTVFMINAHLFLRDPNVIQGVWNLRDQFKVNRRTLALLGPSFRLTPELESDVILLDEPLPTRDELVEIVKRMYAEAQLTEPAEQILNKAADALTGLAAFTAEQVTAMSLSKNGVDIGALWERKRKAVEQTPGLSVNRSGEKFDDVGGCVNVKTFLQRVIKGKRAPQAIVFIDEIEKALGGTGTDTSGVSQDQLGQLLSYMQDHGANGMIFIGPPGSAKSMLAKCAGNEAEIPTITFDLGGMKGSLVGESEERIRGALKVVTSVSQDKALFIATCNSIAALPPELRRRFKRGTFFFDLPTRAERDEIWGKHIAKLELDATDARPDDNEWTGAEISQCCDMSWDMGMTLVEAADFVVPVARSAGDAITRLREMASGRFISASHKGVYEYQAKDTDDSTPPPVVRGGGRKMTVS